MNKWNRKRVLGWENCMLIKKTLLILLFSLFCCSVVSAASTINSYSPSSTSGEEIIPRGSSRLYYVPISNIPPNAVITNVEAKFDYIAFNGVEAGVSCRFNKNTDPGTTGGVSLVSQGILPSGNPGSTGFIGFNNWNGQSVNGNYYFRISMANQTAYDPTIDLVSVRITYVIPQITVTYPNGGETLTKGQDYTVTWASSNVTSNIKVELYKAGSPIPVVQMAANDPNDGSLVFNPSTSLTDGSDYKIAVAAVNGSADDLSDSSFQINSPLVRVPNNGATVSTKDVLFDWDDVPGAVSYEILVDNNSGFGSPEINEPGIHTTSLTTSEYSVTNWFANNVYYWKVIAHLGDGSSQTLDTLSFTYQLLPDPKPVWVPFYRFYKGVPDEDHFYSTSLSHGVVAVGSGYTYERIENYISDRKFPEGTPLFRLYNPLVKSHFYTTDEVQKDEMCALNGYQYEGIQGYVYASATQGGVPLHRLKEPKAAGGDRFLLCTRETEYQEVLSNPTWNFVDDGIAGYVYQAESEAHNKPQGNYKGVDLATLAYRAGSLRPDLSLAGLGPDMILTHHYNSFNFLRLPMGQGWSHSFYSYILEDADHQFVIIKWGDGTETTFVYNSTQSKYVAEKGSYLELTRINDGVNEGYDVKSKEGSLFQFRTFSANATNGMPSTYLIYAKDKNSNTLTFQWEASRGHLLKVTDAVGRFLDFQYADSKNIDLLTKVTESALNRSVLFGYDADGRLVNFTDAKGQVTTYTYDVNDFLTQIKSPRQSKRTIEYNPDGTVRTLQEGNISTKISFIRNLAGALNVTTANGKLLEFSHSGYALTQKKDAYGRATELKHTDTNNTFLLSEVTQRSRNVGELGENTKYDYDTRGNVVKITNNLNLTSELEYNDPNNSNLVTRTIEFHSTGQTGIVTDFVSDAKGNLTDITNGNGENTHYIYSANGLLQSSRDGRGYVTTYEYDVNGNLKKATDPEGNITEYSYDAAGRLQWHKDPLGYFTYFQSDENDNRISTKNNRQFSVFTDFDSNDNLQKVRWVKGGVLSETSYSFFNDVDRLQATQDPLGQTTSYSYLPAGEIQSFTDSANQTKSFAYNDNAVLSETTYPDLTKRRITRYDNDLVKSVEILSSTGTTLFESLFTYDDLNRLQTYTGPYGKLVQYIYDNSGRLSQLIYPGNNSVTYEYDAAGRLEKVSDWVGGTTTYVYDAAGNLTQITRPNGTLAVYTYDLASRLTNIVEKKADGTIICSYAYLLDNAGNITSVSANEPLAGTVPNASQSYTHDKANRLLSAGTTNFTYDNNGNRKTRVNGSVTTNYSWDFENMLTGITNATNSAQYVYDGMNNRVARIKNGQTTRYVLDLSGDMSKVLCETDGTGTITAYYIYGLGLISRIDTSGSRSFYHSNNRGDTISLTDDLGDVTDIYAYDEYGKLLGEGSGNQTPNPFKFVGRYGVMDEGDNLYFMRARFYDAKIGRFLSEDPLGFGGGGVGFYQYAKNNPLTFIDSNGETPFAVAYLIYKFGYKPAKSAMEIYYSIERMKYFNELIDFTESALRKMEDKDQMATDQYQRIKSNHEWAQKKRNSEVIFIGIKVIEGGSVYAMEKIYMHSGLRISADYLNAILR